MMKIASVWRSKTKAGKAMLSGRLDVGRGRLVILMRPRPEGDTGGADRRPTADVFLDFSPPRRDDVQVKDEDSDDDLPF